MLDALDRPILRDDAPENHGQAPRAGMASANHWVPHDIVMRDTWFPLAHSSSVGKKPVRRAIYSHP